MFLKEIGMVRAHVNWIFRIVILGVLFFSLGGVGVSLAQDADTGESQEAAADSPFEQEQTGDAVAEFQGYFTRWKDILKELREIRTEYAIAEQKDLEKLKERWNERIDAGNALMPQLRRAAVAAYAVAPGQDKELERLLIEMVADDVKRDDYAAADALGSEMLAHGASDPTLTNLVGIAAYATNDFERAEKLLKEADKQGALTEQGENFLQSVAENQELWKKEVALREAEAKADDLPRVKLETSAGDIVLELFENEAPETVGNFVSLVEKGFYDGLVFHRVLPGFMAQGGCPKKDGTGDPGYSIYCECYKDNYRRHFAGSISMANSGTRNSGGSQFFITFVPTTHLNGRHTVFGRVIEGMDVLPKIKRVNPEDAAAPNDRTVIRRATVVRKRDHVYQPKKVG